MDGGGLLPLGGTEKTGGYKGYGLGMMVEFFCSVLAGSIPGPDVRCWSTFDAPADLVRIFVMNMINGPQHAACYTKGLHNFIVSL